MTCLRACTWPQARNCAPTTSCAETKRGGDWTICLDDLDATQCLVYSIGIANDWRFDLAMAELGCEVHAFDPTVALPEQLAANITFHQWGLQVGGAPRHLPVPGLCN